MKSDPVQGKKNKRHTDQKGNYIYKYSFTVDDMIVYLEYLKKYTRLLPNFSKSQNTKLNFKNSIVFSDATSERLQNKIKNKFNV